MLVFLHWSHFQLQLSANCTRGFSWVHVRLAGSVCSFGWFSLFGLCRILSIDYQSIPEPPGLYPISGIHSPVLCWFRGSKSLWSRLKLTWSSAFYRSLSPPAIFSSMSPACPPFSSRSFFHSWLRLIPKTHPQSSAAPFSCPLFHPRVRLKKEKMILTSRVILGTATPAYSWPLEFFFHWNLNLYK